MPITTDQHMVIPGRTLAEACDRMDGTVDGALDFFAERIADMVVMGNVDTITEELFWPKFYRTYDAALPEFLTRVEKCNSQLATRLKDRIGEPDFRDETPVR
jgi:hypothetical protein